MAKPIVRAPSEPESRPGLNDANTGYSVMVVDDEVTTLNLCADLIRSLGLRPLLATTAEEALELVEKHQVDIVLADLLLPAMSGQDLLERLRISAPPVAVVIMTGYGSVDSAVRAMKCGAYDYIQKPFHTDEMTMLLKRLVDRLELETENRVLREQLRTKPGFGGLVGSSPKMQKVYKLILKVSQSRYPVLVIGESGTGKELVARSIHYTGPLRERPFLPIECSALVPTLVESELFGYVRGAFTGAVRSKEGLLEAAQGGTIFFDEIAELSSELQAKLLRFLQEKEIRPVGSTRSTQVDVRVIAASNQDIQVLVREGRFRKDLYFRLNVVTIKLPPLRERRSDIPLLVAHFLEKFAEPSRPVSGVSEEVMARFLAYDWPGNVREFENAIERAMALGSSPVIETADLPTTLHHPTSDLAPQSDELVPLQEMERRVILRAVKECHGDKLQAARILGIGKTTLYRKLKEYESQS